MTRLEAIAQATAELSSPRTTPKMAELKRARIARYEAMTEAEYQAEAAAFAVRVAPSIRRMIAESRLI